MKRLVFIFLIPILFLNIGCFRQDIKKLTISVPQMENRECADIIANALHIRGVLGVEANLPEKSIDVTYNSLKISSKNIETAISKAGFDANSILANPKSRAKLPNELKKKESAQ